MPIPPEFREDADRFPAALRALLDAELAAGNQIVSVGHSFPAAPVGAFFKLSKRFTTRERASEGGLKFRDNSSSLYAGSFTDAAGFFFLLEPPAAPPPEPDMDAIREAANTPRVMPIQSDPATALGRFERSMVIDYERWHDGIGYDIDALRAATPSERNGIETLLLQRGIRDWRDVEALAALGTPRAEEALKSALTNRDTQIRLAVMRHAPALLEDQQRVTLLVKALETAKLFEGLSDALDEAVQFHPREVLDALFRGALRRDGESAVHIAALLMFLYGQADEPFDWQQRPFFLRFHTADAKERFDVFQELCGKIGVEASKYL